MTDMITLPWVVACVIEFIDAKQRMQLRRVCRVWNTTIPEIPIYEKMHQDTAMLYICAGVNVRKFRHILFTQEPAHRIKHMFPGLTAASFSFDIYLDLMSEMDAYGIDTLNIDCYNYTNEDLYEPEKDRTLHFHTDASRVHIDANHCDIMVNAERATALRLSFGTFSVFCNSETKVQARESFVVFFTDYHKDSIFTDCDIDRA